MSDATNLGSSSEIQTPSGNSQAVETTATVPGLNTVTEQPRVEPTYTRDQLARAVKDSTKNVYDKAYQDALKKIQDEQAVKTQQQQPATNSQAQPVLDEAKIREITRQEQERTEKEREIRSHYENIGNSFVGKVVAARQTDPDLDNKLVELGMDFGNMTAADPRVALFNSIDNVGEVIAEMHTNPTKLGSILELLAYDSKVGSSLSFRELKKLSDSIKLNKAAKDSPKAPKPPTQIEPSTAGLGSGEISISADRKKAQYRF